MNDKSFNDYVYLDWAATAPLSEEAAHALQPYYLPGQNNIAVGANANSLHSPGRAAFAALEQARRQIAHDMGAKRPSEIIFTSGSTEANNTALNGIIQAVLTKAGSTLQTSKRPLVVTSAIEHDAVLEPLRKLARDTVELVELNPAREGFIDPAVLESVLSSNQDAVPVLVSIQMANSEIGAIQPIKELAQIAHKAGAIFHTDATQALGKMPLNLDDLGVDAASFSAHKVGGPKGVGALYLKARTPFQAQLLGGGQEEGRRSTTQNVAGAVGFAAACHAVTLDCIEESARERKMRDSLYAKLTLLPGVHPAVLPPADSTNYLPHIVTVVVPGLESETMILRLDEKGFGVAGGSACASHSLAASHVLRSIGIDSDAALGELRISFGSLTTPEDLERFAEAFEDCIAAR